MTNVTTLFLLLLNLWGVLPLCFFRVLAQQAATSSSLFFFVLPYGIHSQPRISPATDTMKTQHIYSSLKHNSAVDISSPPVPDRTRGPLPSHPTPRPLNRARCNQIPRYPDHTHPAGHQSIATPRGTSAPRNHRIAARPSARRSQACRTRGRTRAGAGRRCRCPTCTRSARG